jgi:hypothetical protein
MSGARFEWNPGGLAKLRNMAQAANQQAQEIVRQVNAEKAGEPVEDVLAVLRARIAQAGTEPNEDGLRKYAEAISRRTLRE